MDKNLTWRMLTIPILITISLFALNNCSPDAASSDPPIPPIRVLARSDGATRLTTPPTGSSDQNPAFSPDGTRLVFTRFDTGYNYGPAGLFLVNASGGTPTRLTSYEDQDNVNLPGSAWNATNNRIVFSSDRLDADGLWRIAPPDESDFSRIITHTSPITYLEPSWSPDGQWIVFEASQPGDSEDGRVGQVWKVRASGGDLAQLSGDGHDDRQPNWSPAGDKILFQRRSLPDGQWDIYTIAPDGSAIHQATTTPASDTDASWSPGGGCIVYSSDYADLPVANIYAIPATGGTPVRVTNADVYDGAPSWSPDGQWIAFESANDPAEDSPTSLWRIAAPACDEDEYYVYVPVALTPVGSSMLAVNDFLYQLQNLDLTAVGASAYDLVVMDYSADGDDASAYTAAEITTLKNSPGGPKIVLSYMSIGEAEDYRFYWQSAWEPGNPPWLDEENPDWGGNYKVHYWDPAWQAIIFSYTDRLLDAGFDGAYLDIIDGYEYYAGSRPTAAQDMADFVAAIRAYAHARDPDFYIFPQNASELADEIAGYLDIVDGIGQEDIYYGYEDDDEMTPPAATAELEDYLDLFTNDGKLVLTVDYATTPAHIDDAYTKSQAQGYVPFVTVRDLDQLTINPGHEPD